MATRDENHQQLVAQAREAQPAAPEMPKLGHLMKGKCNPVQQDAFDKYDQAMADWDRARQVSKT
jgi:hypothetical protein